MGLDVGPEPSTDLSVTCPVLAVMSCWTSCFPTTTRSGVTCNQVRPGKFPRGAAVASALVDVGVTVLIRLFAKEGLNLQMTKTAPNEILRVNGYSNKVRAQT